MHALTKLISGLIHPPSSVTVPTRPPPRRSSSWVPSRRTSSAPLKCFLLSYEKSCLRHDRRFVIQLAVWQLGKTSAKIQNDSHPINFACFSLFQSCVRDEWHVQLMSITQHAKVEEMLLEYMRSRQFVPGKRMDFIVIELTYIPVLCSLHWEATPPYSLSAYIFNTDIICAFS